MYMYDVLVNVIPCTYVMYTFNSPSTIGPTTGTQVIHYSRILTAFYVSTTPSDSYKQQSLGVDNKVLLQSHQT